MPEVIGNWQVRLWIIFVDRLSSNCCRCMSFAEHRAVVVDVIGIHPRRTRDKTSHRSWGHRALNGARSALTRQGRPLHHLHHERRTIVWRRGVRLEDVASVAIIGSVILGRSRIQSPILQWRRVLRRSKLKQSASIILPSSVEWYVQSNICRGVRCKIGRPTEVVRRRWA